MPEPKAQMNLERLADYLGFAAKQLLALLPEEQCKEMVDDWIDAAEKAVEKSNTKLDDAVLNPVFATIRKTISIPDDIGGDED